MDSLRGRPDGYQDGAKNGASDFALASARADRPDTGGVLSPYE